MKALIVATGYLKQDGIHVYCVPEFADLTIEDKVRTAIKLVIEPQNAADLPAEWTRRVVPAPDSQIAADTDAAE